MGVVQSLGESQRQLRQLPERELPSRKERCGMCAHLCPREVLKVENKPGRFKGGTSIRVYAVDL